MPSTEYSILADKLTKRFGDFTAVDSISFDVLPGEVFGLSLIHIFPPNRCSFPSGVVGWGVAIQRSSPDRSRDQSGLQVC